MTLNETVVAVHITGGKGNKVLKWQTFNFTVVKL